MNDMLRSAVDKIVGLSLLLLTIAPFALVSWFVWTSYLDRTDETIGLGERYDRLRAIAAFNPDSLLARGAENPVSKYFLGEGTPAILTATLQAKVREMAGQNGVEVVQASELSFAADEAAISKLGIRLEMSGPASGILAILLEIENAVPWLFVGNVQLRSGYAEGLEQGPEPAMAIGMDVWGVISKAPVKVVTP